MISVALLAVTIGAPVLGATGQIYRCASTDGSVHYQELPCAKARELELPAGEANNEANLRRWLQELRSTLPTAPTTSTVVSNTPRQPRRTTSYAYLTLPARPTSQSALAGCSALFLQCADSDDQRMDRCVEKLPQCNTHQSASCCESAYVIRYQLLREAGAPRKLAVRDALLAD